MGKNAPEFKFIDLFTCYKKEPIPDGVLILFPTNQEEMKDSIRSLNSSVRVISI